VRKASRASPEKSDRAVKVTASPVAGYCPEAIHQAAAQERADLIIISTHGRTGFRRALVGSVAEGTVRSAACPVLVVPSFASTRKKFVDKSARRPVMQTLQQSRRRFV